MRLSYSNLFSNFLSNTQNPGSTDAVLTDFFSTNVNPRYQLVFAELQDYQNSNTQTAATVTGQQYYHNPPGFVNIEDMTIGSPNSSNPLLPLDSQLKWDSLGYSIGTPQFFFQRKDDFGVWPIPQSNELTITLNYYYRDRGLTTADYITGTVTVVNNSQAVTGSGTTWTSDMVGRWFNVNGNGYEYRIIAVGSTTTLTLESYYEGPSAAAQAYRVAQTPELPEEAHILVSDGVTSDWFSGPRKDTATGAWWNNKFWTGDGNDSNRNVHTAFGGLLGLKKRYSTRSNRRVITHKTYYNADPYKLFSSSIS